MTDITRPRKSWKTIALIQLVLLPLLLVGADVVLGSVNGYDRDETWQEMAIIVESMQSGVPDPGRTRGAALIEKADLRLHPYTGFGPKHLNESHTQEFARLEQGLNASEYRIMILGGSVSEGFGNPGSEGAGQVRRALKRDPRFTDRRIRFLPQGYGSYKQPQQLILTSYLLGAGVEPHAIISLDGFNEVALSQQNGEAGMNPSFPSFSQWVHLAKKWGSGDSPVQEALGRIAETREACVELAGLAERFGLLHSSLIGPRLVGRMKHERREFAKASKRYLELITNKDGFGTLSGPAYSREPRVIAEQAVSMWKESTRNLKAICDRNGIFFLNVLQPTLHDVGSKELTQSEVVTGRAIESWVTGVNLGYPLLKQAGRELAEEGVNYLDASQVFRGVAETLYYDPCHFNQAGYKVLGAKIGRFFVEALPENELPESDGK